MKRAFERFRALRLMIVALAATMALTACDFDIYSLPLPGGADVGDEPLEITVMFADVLDLVPQSSVKVNDISVGRVTEIDLDGQTAVVKLIMRGDIDLPDNSVATLRQTSLLGEKFVAIDPPDSGASADPLEDGDVIGLERTGRNPEVEEVFGALSLLLNGGGVAQLRTINQELNKTLNGREANVRSALQQIDVFVTELDDNKTDIIKSIEQLNRLSLAVRDDLPSIDNALDNLPSALNSLDRQRDDLVRMLTALNELSDVGVRVIQQSKGATIEALQQLQPTLTELADSGDAFVDAFNVALTFPFVDEVVGRDPQVARNLQMGDFTNLSVLLELDLSDLEVVCLTLNDVEDQILGGTPLENLINAGDLCTAAEETLNACLDAPSVANCSGLPVAIVQNLCDQAGGPLSTLCAPGGGGGGGGLPLPLVPREGAEAAPSPPDVGQAPRGEIEGGGLEVPSDAPAAPSTSSAPGADVDASGLNRPRVGSGGKTRVKMGDLMDAYDPALVTLLVPSMAVAK